MDTLLHPKAPRPRALLLAVGLAGLYPLATPVLSPAALAEASGGKPSHGATGGALSSNPIIHRQQLIADPEGAEFGSDSVIYDPTEVSLESVFQLSSSPPYQINGGYVGVQVASVTAVQALSDFFAHPAGPQTGYVQVQWSSGTGGPPYYGIAPDGPAGYTSNGRFGEANPANGGDDTFGLQFHFLPADPTASDTYEVEEDAQTFPIYDSTRGFLGTNNSPDSYTSMDAAGDVYTFDASDTDPAFDTVNDVPEPASAGLLGLAALGLLARRRQGRQERT